MSPGPRRVRTLLVVGLAAAVLAWLASSAFVAWRLTHRARPLYAEPVPARGAGRVREEVVATRDGQRLGAWFLPRASPRAAVLVLHGSGGSRSDMLDLALWLSDQGLAVLVPSLRAHGDSTGDSNDFGWSSREDVLACVGDLEVRAPGVPIVVYGCSLGAVAAIYAARELGPRVAGYALEAPYRDVRSATRHRLRLFLPPVLDQLAFAGLVLLAPSMLEPDLDLLAPIDHVAGIPAATPVVFLSGTADVHAPTAEVEEIRARCGARAAMVLFPGADHRSLWAFEPARLHAALLELVAETLPR
jgi:alpha-beta hydrolase superfamily lysophospholipase